MDRQGPPPGEAETRELATELLRQGRRLAQGGWLAQAGVVLEQIWEVAGQAAPDLANSAAWGVGWLAVRRGEYTVAGTWFARMTGPPAYDGELWSVTYAALLGLCLAQVSAPADPAVPGAPLRSAAWPARMRIHSLGRFQIFRDDEALSPCTTRRPLAIFRYLLTRPQWAANKEELMELFWPDSPASRAAHSLHAAITAVRHYLDPPRHTYLVFEAGHYRINPQMPVEDDCRIFKAELDQADRGWAAGDLARAQQGYVAALAHYQGDYYLDDQDQDWALTEREQLLVRYLLALDRLGRTYMAEQRYEAAIDSYQRLLRSDAYREDAHGQLIRCYWYLGRRSEALQQYQRCAEILSHDLGLKPLPETQALYQAIMLDDRATSHKYEAHHR